MSDISFQTKPLHQFLADLHLQVRLQTAEEFLAPLGVHGGEIAHQFVARLIFRVLAQTDADGNESGDDPDGDVRSRNHAELKIKKEELGSQKRAVLPAADSGCFMAIMSDTGTSFSAAISRDVNNSTLALGVNPSPP
jgi:hypothetical protein